MSAGSRRPRSPFPEACSHLRRRITHSTTWKNVLERLLTARLYVCWEHQRELPSPEPISDFETGPTPTLSHAAEAQIQSSLLAFRGGALHGVVGWRGRPA